MARRAHPRLHPKVKDFLHFLVISCAVHSEASAYLILAACQSWQFYLLVFPKNLSDIGQASQLGEKGVSQPRNDKSRLPRSLGGVFWFDSSGKKKMNFCLFRGCGMTLMFT